MIESTLVERQAYVVAMIHELDATEKAKKRQSLVHPWIDVTELFQRIQRGLLCTYADCDRLLTPFLGDKIEVYRTGKFVRIVGGAI